MKNIARLITTIAVAASVALGVAACAPTAEPIELAAGTVVIDVRTPAEFAEGHLEGALNIDVQGAEFAAQIAELPTTGEFIVYCRSGNRAASAVALMEAAGFENLTNAGGLSDASASTGLAIVT
jgi:rhodanese-related sulfurtransferase